MNDFSHLDKSGNVKMVDVTEKVSTIFIMLVQLLLILRGEDALAPERVREINGNQCNLRKINENPWKCDGNQ